MRSLALILQVIGINLNWQYGDVKIRCNERIQMKLGKGIKFPVKQAVPKNSNTEGWVHVYTMIWPIKPDCYRLT